MTQPTATDVHAAVADIIERHITGTFKRRWRAECTVADLHTAGLLRGGKAPNWTTTRGQVENVLQCRYDWPTAETIAAELDAAGLLRGH